MSKENKVFKEQANNTRKLRGVIVLMIGFILFIVWIFIGMIDFAITAEAVPAKVHSVSNEITSSNGKTSTRKSVRVDFTYEGVEYKSVSLLGDLSGVFYEGEQITVYVDPDDLNNVQPDRFSFSGFLWCVVLLALLVVMFRIVFSSASNVVTSGTDGKRKKYVENGRLVIATVEEVVDTGIWTDGKTLCYLRCSGKVDGSQIIRFFESHKIWSDCKLNAKAGDSVNVYIMNNDYNNYYVDIEDLQKSMISDYSTAQ